MGFLGIKVFNSDSSYVVLLIKCVSHKIPIENYQFLKLIFDSLLIRQSFQWYRCELDCHLCTVGPMRLSLKILALKFYQFSFLSFLNLLNFNFVRRPMFCELGAITRADGSCVFRETNILNGTMFLKTWSHLNLMAGGG